MVVTPSRTRHSHRIWAPVRLIGVGVGCCPKLLLMRLSLPVRPMTPAARIYPSLRSWRAGAAAAVAPAVGPGPPHPIHVDAQRPCCQIEGDDIAIADRADWPAAGRFGGDVSRHQAPRR